uniref:CDAN1-interacting nuclease 1 n=1 Tax=Homalodisca liturata TaxID=320908 RepID=A0A1B6IAV3_9HEMI
MEVNVFQGIIHFINNFRGLSRDCMLEMKRIYPDIPENTLGSILCTKYQKKMMANHGKVKQKKQIVVKRYKEGLAAGEEPGLIIRIAKFYDVAPALMAKVILEECLEKNNDKDQNGYSKNAIKEMLKDTTLIPDPDLAYEVFMSIVFDNMYGSIADVTKRSLGVEYEVKLYHHVQRVGLSYKSEEQLRARGYDKTPDIRLDVPCAVDGFVINWIESKAIFGDNVTHDQYAHDQYYCYWNRFGPGLVIYWLGYLETVPQPSEKRFIVRDSFPENITLMDPSLIQVPTLDIC